MEPTKMKALRLKPKLEFSGEYKDREMLVVAYVRVSTDRKEQQTSFKTQLNHYQTFIAQHPNWTLYKIYAEACVII